jgi:6-phosphogluconolactonase/glucosamine-6-phosphate isomerase/deaminase
LTAEIEATAVVGSNMDIRVDDNPADAAGRWIARRLRDAVRRRGSGAIAVSGGSTAPALFEALQSYDVPWSHTTIWQVDERVAPDGDSDRNAEQLIGVPGRVHLMPVTSKDLRSAARRYSRGLPDRFDIVHLGMGGDGHTASWPPGDPVVESVRKVETIAEFNGRKRMTLTPVVVNAARSRVVLTLGSSKAAMVKRWIQRDPEIPIARVRRQGTVVFLNADAASHLQV